MQISYRIRSQISTPDYLREDKDGHRANVTKTMRIQGNRNHRSRGVQRSYSHAHIDTAEIQCRADNGISQREKQPNDFREIRKPQVQVWEPAFLMPGLLCKYSRSEQEGNSRVYPKSATGRLHRRPNEYKGVCRPVYGSANNRGQINRSPFRGSPWKLRGWQTFRWAYRLDHGHAPRGLVHTTGTAGGYDLTIRG